MKIDRSNYEAWFLDESEGKLSREEQETLRNFLLLNPDLEEEFNSLLRIKILPDPVKFEHKNDLKKVLPPEGTMINRFNFNLFAIAWIENDLLPEQRLAFEKLIREDAFFFSELEAMKKTVLLPEKVLFKGKAGLKKKPAVSRRIIPLITGLSAAAAVVLALILFTGNGKQEQTLPVAVLNKEVPVVNEKAENHENREEVRVNPLTIKSRQKEQPPDHNAPLKVVGTNAPAVTTDGDTLIGFNRNAIQIASADLPTGTLPEIRPVFDKIRPVYIPQITSYERNAPIQLVARKEFERLKMTLDNTEDLSLWDLASAGIRGINKVAGTDMTLMASRNKDRDVAGISFTSKAFSVSAPLGRGNE